MNRGEIETVLRKADRAFQEEGLTPALDAQLRARLKRRLHRGRPWLPTLAAVAGAAACAALALVLWLPEPPAPPALEPSGTRTLVGLALVRASADLVVDEVGDELTVRAGACTLTDPRLGTQIALDGSTVLRREGTALRVIRGRVVFAMRRDPARVEPVRVLVSHGSIEVTGTRFTVVQGEGRGSVTLHEGAIRFRDLAGRTVVLAPGESLSWPLPLPVPEATAPVTAERGEDDGPEERTDESAPVRPPAAASSLDEVMDRVAFLRSRSRYESAARELAAALRESRPMATRERLSFELGSILTHQLRDRERACAHWGQHARRFAAGRYVEEVLQATRALECPVGRD
jgi:transmembrane sensor